jgi:hypothetical protein
MTNDRAITNYHSFDEEDVGYSGLIRGIKLKFSNDSRWLAGKDDPMPPEVELVAVELVRVSQKWVGCRPVETLYLAPGEEWPDIEELNSQAPKEEWRDVNGQRKGPWENFLVLYLFDPATMQPYTYPTATVGGRRAIGELKRQAKLGRMLKGNAFPVVTLGETFMPTRFGGRQRPDFKIKRFIPLEPGGESIAAENTPLLGEKKPSGPHKPNDGDDMNDEIPW